MIQPWKSTIVIEASQLEEANQLAAQIDQEGGIFTFGVAMFSPSGELPVTHYACHTHLTDKQRVLAQQGLATLDPTPRFYTCNNGAINGTPDLLQATNSPTAQSAIGTLWNWTASLNDMGLTRYHPPEDE